MNYHLTISKFGAGQNLIYEDLERVLSSQTNPDNIILVGLGGFKGWHIPERFDYETVDTRIAKVVEQNPTLEDMIIAGPSIGFNLEAFIAGHPDDNIKIYFCERVSEEYRAEKQLSFFETHNKSESTIEEWNEFNNTYNAAIDSLIEKYNPEWTVFKQFVYDFDTDGIAVEPAAQTTLSYLVKVSIQSPA
jgi:hypothetical protein